MLNDLNVDVGSKTQSQKHCTECSRQVSAESRFCAYCGFPLHDDLDETGTEKWQVIKQVGLFFSIEAIICCSASFINVFKTLSWGITAKVTLAIVAITFFCTGWSKFKFLLTWKSFSLIKLLGCCVAAVLGSVIIGFLASQLNQSLFSHTFSYYAFYANYKYGEEVAILFIAVMPALFEELAYRGFLLGKLTEIVDKRQAIFISSFLFAIMHMSFISLFWLIPFGLLLGFIRLKEKTLWYGIFFHFTFNFTTTLIDIFRFGHHI
jgi:uncharacterized protein